MFSPFCPLSNFSGPFLDLFVAKTQFTTLFGEFFWGHRCSQSALGGDVSP